ncbi:hypothetical protein DFH11DRAFT_1554897 [Phellopilus nigrolimitatus]|nr:hypothetical protein DFH11DRAFT_1554897 [Phellopilus nigrolimitatus]
MSGAPDSRFLERQAGNISRLVDDTIVRVLLFCDTIALLCLEQTCRYLKLLIARREVWIAVLHRLPRESMPSIAPHERRDEADFRELAIRAMRGYRNWTSNSPKPSRRVRLDVLNHRSRLIDPQLLPDKRHMLYFWEHKLCCVDVERDAYVLERYHNHVEVPWARIYPSSGSTFPIEVIELSFASRECTPVSTVVVNWQNICDVARYDYVMLDGFDPTVNTSLLFIPFKARLPDGKSTRGAIVVDWMRHLTLLLSFQNCNETENDFSSPSCIVNDHVLYITGRGSDCPSICSVHLSRFNEYWRDCSSPTSWVNLVVNPNHATSFPLPLLPPETPSTIFLSIHPSNWLDLEKAKLKNPHVASLSLIDMTYCWNEYEGSSIERLSRSFHLHFSEWPVSDTLTLGQFSLESNPDLIIRAEFIMVPNPLPSRHGRLALHTRKRLIDPQSRPQTRAIALLSDSTSSTVLEHLDKRFARQIIMEYYSSTVIINTLLLRDSNGPDSIEFVLEQYD